MRKRFTAIYGVGLALMLGLAPASAQEPKFWPNEKISFPIDTDKLNGLDPKPTKLRFYAAAPRGKFERSNRIARFASGVTQTDSSPP